jgi:hypothetical protein
MLSVATNVGRLPAMLPNDIPGRVGVAEPNVDDVLQCLVSNEEDMKIKGVRTLLLCCGLQ